MNLLDVNLANHLTYPDPDNPMSLEIWKWVACNASFSHRDNGTGFGVFEFILNLSRDYDDMPERLSVIVAIESRKQRAKTGQRWHYALFHQGT